MAQLLRHISTTILPMALLWAGCHNPDDFVLNSDMDRFLTLSAADTTLQADGFSSVELVAQVHDVSAGSPAVLFTATAGSLRVGTIVLTDSVGAIVGIDSTVVRTNAAGETRIRLISEPRLTTAHVRARVADIEPSVQQEIRIHFQAVADEEMVAFVDPPDSALAHGLALVPFTVGIAPELAGEERAVRFEAMGGGTFPFSDTTGVQIVRVDAAGLATAYLGSPEEAGESLVRATARTFTAQHVIRFVHAPTDSVLRFVEAPETAPADGHSVSRLSVEISPLLQEEQDRTVEFLTTLGAFVLADDEDGATVSVRADAEGIATAFLRSPGRFDEAFVRASVKGFIQQRTLRFDWAGPDSIFVRSELNRVLLAAGEQIQIQADLIRLDGRGQVTEGLEVSFAVVDNLGNPLEGARFLDVTHTNAEGRASAFLALGDTPYEGPATVSVRPARIASEVVGQVELTIISP